MVHIYHTCALDRNKPKLIIIQLIKHQNHTDWNKPVTCLASLPEGMPRSTRRRTLTRKRRSRLSPRNLLMVKNPQRILLRNVVLPLSLNPGKANRPKRKSRQYILTRWVLAGTKSLWETLPKKQARAYSGKSAGWFRFWISIAKCVLWIAPI